MNLSFSWDHSGLQSVAPFVFIYLVNKQFGENKGKFYVHDITLNLSYFIQIKHKVDHLLGKKTVQHPFDHVEGRRSETGQSNVSTVYRPSK